MNIHPARKNVSPLWSWISLWRESQSAWFFFSVQMLGKCSFPRKIIEIGQELLVWDWFIRKQILPFFSSIYCIPQNGKILLICCGALHSVVSVLTEKIMQFGQPIAEIFNFKEGSRFSAPGVISEKVIRFVCPLSFRCRIRNCSTAKTREDIAKRKRKVENDVSAFFHFLNLFKHTLRFLGL